jgi:hypothetical protein
LNSHRTLLSEVKLLEIRDSNGVYEKFADKSIELRGIKSESCTLRRDSTLTAETSVVPELDICYLSGWIRGWPPQGIEKFIVPSALACHRAYCRLRQAPPFAVGAACSNCLLT